MYLQVLISQTLQPTFIDELTTSQPGMSDRPASLPVLCGILLKSILNIQGWVLYILKPHDKDVLEKNILAEAVSDVHCLPCVFVAPCGFVMLCYLALFCFALCLTEIRKHLCLTFYIISASL